MGGHPSIRISGPLSGFVSSVYDDLRSEGYAVLSAAHVLNVMSHLSRWMAEQALSITDVDAERLDDFVRHRRAIGYRQHLSMQSLRPIIRSLRRSGIELPVEGHVVVGPREQLLQDFAHYLERERCLAPTTVRAYGKVARRFIEESLDAARPAADGLSAAQVSAFVVRASRSLSPGNLPNAVTALRALMRWLYLRGDIASDLAASIPAVAGWRLASLPRGIDGHQVEQLLRSCDRRRSVGRRDYPVLLLMVRMGLRAGEVAALQLDDIDWSAAEITIRGKGSKQSRLPLPAQVGAAIAGYLKRGRPRRPCRKLFLSSRAPYEGLAPRTIVGIVRAAFKRIGAEPPHRPAHALRHTAATQMLRRGGSLSEIAQVLRHAHIDTTAIYAKVDQDALRQLARPWPGGAA